MLQTLMFRALPLSLAFWLFFGYCVAFSSRLVISIVAHIVALPRCSIVSLFKRSEDCEWNPKC